MALPSRLSSTWVRRCRSPARRRRSPATAPRPAPPATAPPAGGPAPTASCSTVPPAHRLERQRVSTRLDARDLQHLVDQLQQVPARLDDVAHALLVLRRQSARSSSCAKPRIEFIGVRSSWLMRTEELALGAVRALGRLAGTLRLLRRLPDRLLGPLALGDIHAVADHPLHSPASFRTGRLRRSMWLLEVRALPLQLGLGLLALRDVAGVDHHALVGSRRREGAREGLQHPPAAVPCAESGISLGTVVPGLAMVRSSLNHATSASSGCTRNGLQVPTSSSGV
jgi:hypothetical protein